MLLLHVVIALSSLVYTTIIFFKPGKNRIKISYLFAAFTLITGTYLVVMSPSHLVQSCIMGIMYVGFVTLATLSAQRKIKLDTPYLDL